ncbi:Mur ligase family protein [Lamprobacter modestohalophilus]|uniref:Mur ligase family protein n=1 Tax=Lamprobacter modestohalophilus TaxID=1064514 RepID=UPI002ADEB636|nr:Mur ligase family protein [Lamprobacter modestohalophilus]MEA1052782.1 Mur ligase family protein [Lamprobacter modestohalophilus]
MEAKKPLINDLDEISFIGDAQGHTLFGHKRFNVKPEDELCEFNMVLEHGCVIKKNSPEALTRTAKASIRLHPLAASSLTKAAQWIDANCGHALKANWGYRSLEEQHRLFRNRLLKGDFNQAIQRVAPPGWSEHHTGLVVDLDDSGECVTGQLPYFGWEQFFPETTALPIQHEPWHWRFVGAPVIQKALATTNSRESSFEIGHQNLHQYQEIDFTKVFLGAPPPARWPRDPYLLMAEYLLELGHRIPPVRSTDYRRVLLEAAISTLKAQKIEGADSPQAVLLALAVLVPLLPNDRSERVMDFQKHLARLGIFQQAATGFFGPQTMESMQLSRRRLGEPRSTMVDINLLRSVRARTEVLLETFSPARLAEVLNGEWIGVSPDHLRLSRLLNGSTAQHIKHGDLVVARCATEEWDALHSCLSLIDDSKGAALMIDGDEIPANITVPILKVRRTRRAISQLGRIAKARASGRFIVVTGSSGKTTTKNVIRHLLSQQGIVRGTDGSRNNLRAISYSLVNSISSADFFVMESGLGMAGSGIYQHSKLLEPEVAIITSVHAAHAGGYESIEEIVHLKMDVAAGLKPDGYLLIDGDSDQLPLMKQLAVQHGVKNLVTFGFGQHCDVRVVHYRADGTRGVTTLSLSGEVHRICFNMLGVHWAKMAAAVLACGAFLGVDLERMAGDFESVPLPPGRGAVIGHLGKTLVVFDSHYNANPGSMKADLSAFGELQLPVGSRKIAVIGSMAELGANSRAYHLAIQPDIAAVGFSRIYLVGEEAAVLEDALSNDAVVTCHAKTESVIESLKEELMGSECFFIKGSRSNELENVAHFLTRYINEQQKQDSTERVA